MERGRLSTKGQVVIPVKMRKRLHLKAKEELLFDLKGNAIIITPVVKLSELRGIASKKGRGLSKALLKEREKELEQEEEKFERIVKKLEQK